VAGPRVASSPAGLHLEGSLALAHPVSQVRAPAVKSNRAGIANAPESRSARSGEQFPSPTTMSAPSSRRRCFLSPGWEATNRDHPLSTNTKIGINLDRRKIDGKLLRH
jgi:hypothetical protein